MASTHSSTDLQVVSEAPTGFKRRQSTMCMAGIYYFIGFLIIGICVGVGLWTGKWINMWRIVIVPFAVFAGLVWFNCPL